MVGSSSINKSGDRIGIIGANGCGKSTLLNALAGLTKVDAGSLKLGDSVKIGYYKQEIDDLDDSKSLISAVREIAEFIDCGVGRDRYLTPRDLLLKFNFPTQQHSSFIGTLSGGERRRLALIRMLMANPNIIFLDEPTNDLDIPTLTSLEEYLEDYYGVLLIVSHDRAFLDRTVDFIWAFEENGKVKEYPGNYSFYLEKKEEQESLKRKFNSENKIEKEIIKPKQTVLKKLSYMDQREFDLLEKEIPELETKKEELEKSIYSGKISDYILLDEMSKELQTLTDLIDDKTMRWMELSEKV